MTDLLFVAVEQAIPADHPAAMLAVPIGLLFLSGSVIMLLWSNYGAKKAGAIYGVGFFGFAFLIGVFWWLGGPGIPPGLGVSHLPGQSAGNYDAEWFAFEAGSPRAEYFPGVQDPEAFVSQAEYVGVEDVPEAERGDDPAYGQISGAAGSASQEMLGQFLPVDDNGVAQIGVSRREQFEEDAAAAMPEGAEGRAQPFYSAQPVSEVMLRDGPETGVRLATQEFQAYATYTDADGVPLEPVAVGEATNWFAYYDPGAVWFPPLLWTAIAFAFFLLSLFWLDRLEMREKRLQTVEAEEPERIAEPIAQ